MKIVQIIGGLGNQMFQYALLIALRERFKQDIKYDTCFFNGYSIHNGFELDKIFDITAKKAELQEIKKIYYPFIGHYSLFRFYKHFCPVLKSEIRETKAIGFQKEVFERDEDIYYDGYWQDYRYFQNYRDKIIEEFQFKIDLDDKNKAVFNQLQSTQSVSIHIRRGDYLKNKRFKGICDIEYYSKAIEKVKGIINGDATFILFSNDINWTKMNIVPLIGEDNQIILADWNKGPQSYLDMRLMSACHINIIANSSFSWWGAFLNKNKDQIVIAPKVWVNSVQSCIRQLPSWIKI